MIDVFPDSCDFIPPSDISDDSGADDVSSVQFTFCMKLKITARFLFECALNISTVSYV